MISALVYLSKAQQTFDTAAIEGLVSRTFPNNRRLGITGYLYYRDPWFFQYLEGSEETLSGLMEKIRQDPRHQIMSHFWLDQMEERNFPDWEMQHISDQHIQQVEAADILQSTLEMMSETQQNAMLYETFKGQIEKLVRLVAKHKIGVDDEDFRTP